MDVDLVDKINIISKKEKEKEKEKAFKKNQRHEQDKTLKILFSYPKVIEDLIKGFVPQKWVNDIDFNTLEKKNVEHVSSNTKTRRSDMIWKVKFREKSLFLILLLEFQSKTDYFMSLRIRTYVDLILEDLIRQKMIKRGEYFPPIFPFVLYTGDLTWKAPLTFEQYIDPELAAELKSGLYGNYFYLDVERVAINAGLSNNVVQHLIQLSTERKYSELKQHFANATKALYGREEWGALIKYILSASNTSKRFPTDNLNELTREDMLSARFEQWAQEFRQEGKLEGKFEGINIGERQERLDVLRVLLQKKYPSIPEYVQQRIEAASNLQLKLWINDIINDKEIAVLTER